MKSRAVRSRAASAMADVISPMFEKTFLVHPFTHQPPTPDDNNRSLLVARKSSILKFNRLICLIIWRGD